MAAILKRKNSLPKQKDFHIKYPFTILVTLAVLFLLLFITINELQKSQDQRSNANSQIPQGKTAK